MEKIKFTLQVLALSVALPLLVFAELNHRNVAVETNDGIIQKNIPEKADESQRHAATAVSLHPSWANEPILSINQ